MNNFSISQSTANKIRFVAGIVAATGFVLSKIANAEDMMTTTHLPGMDYSGNALASSEVNYTGNYNDANWVHPESWSATINGTNETITWENITRAMAELNITDVEICYYLRRDSNFTIENNLTTVDQSPLLHAIASKDYPLVNRLYCYMRNLCSRAYSANLAKYLCDWQSDKGADATNANM